MLAADARDGRLAEPARARSRSTVFTDIAGRVSSSLPLAVAAVSARAAAVRWPSCSPGAKARSRKPLLRRERHGRRRKSLARRLSASSRRLVRPGDFWRAYPLVTYLARLRRLAGGNVAVWTRGAALRPRPHARRGLAFGLLFGTALSLALPGATIFFLFAPAIALAGIAFERRSPRAAFVARRSRDVVQFLMFAELLALIEMLLIDGPLWAVAPLAALAAFRR